MSRQGPLVFACLLLAACGGGMTPPTPVIDPPAIVCPVDVTVRGITGASQPVTFAAPVVTGGANPVNSSCTPASGASFPLGTTSVSCTASDAQARQATCSFKVTQTALALGAMKFESVGDSLTEGENGAGPKPQFVDPPNSYPTKLQLLLDTTYPGQGMTVVNRGTGGERVEKTRDLLPGYLATDRPQAVLLLAGYNNLTNPCFPGLADTIPCEAAGDDVVFGVRDCVREAKESPVGVKYIFVSTLTPSGPVAPNAAKDLRIARETILEANRRIREMVAAERVTLVDTYPLFVGHEAEYVSIDGLHLRPAGYQAIADAFFAAIKATVPQTPLASLSGLR
jgi:lysophospholipase L1-like esterase